MDKSKKEAALAELEQITKRSEALRAIIDAPEREPKEGDCWQHNGGEIYHICGNPHSSGLIAASTRRGRQWCEAEDGVFGESAQAFTYKGKFHEVYVKFEDVKAALDHKDIGSASFLDWINDCTAFPDKFTAERTRKLLEKLNIL
jgi:hypothetical protein